MNQESRTVSDNDLHRYVDEQLAPERRAEVDAYLAANPSAARRVRAYQQQNEKLRALTNSTLEEPVPPQLVQAIRPLKWRFSRYATAASWIALGAAVGFFARGADSEIAPGVSLAHRAAIAHAIYTPEVLHPVEVGAQEEAHLVKWLSKRLNTTVRPPRLRAAGFELVGGRLLPDAKGPAAQFMYQNATGQRLTLYVHNNSDDDGQTAFRYARAGEISVFYWIDGSLGYALSGELDRPRLLQVAEIVYRDLNR